MEYKELSNGQKIPTIGMGTLGIGGTFKADASKQDEEIKTIQEGIKLGLTHIDTAEVYGNGLTEKEIGIAIKNFDRKKLFITTKVWKDNLHYNGIISSLENSLKRLQTEYVDLYVIHWPNPNIPIKETMETLEYLAEQGKIKSIGISNFTVREIEQAQKCLKNHRIVANQVKYSLLRREADKEIIPFCEKNNIMIIAYRPLGLGDLTHKGIKILDEIAKKYNKTRAQIAIKWIISHKNFVAITKSTKINHLKQNVDVFEWKLKQKDKEQLDKIANLELSNYKDYS